MNDEATQTQETATQTQSTQTTEQTSPTLEDVYREFNVSIPSAASSPQQIQPTQAPPTLPTAQAPLDIPDPIADAEGFKRWAANQAQAGSAMSQAFQNMTSMLNAQQRETQQAALTKDIAAAVDTVNESVQLPDKQKKLIEFALEDKARQDPRFKQIWDNRRSNPIAWGRALQAFSNEVGEVFSVKVDPQLRQDREALRISQKQSATTKTDANERPDWQNKPADDPEFQRNWQRMVRQHQ